MEKKSEKVAKEYRIIGNSHFGKKEYFDALMFYNLSLCFTENGSEAMSMAFANRSAVYLKLNHFDLCLKNIQLARDNNYPQDKMEKLDKRERDCKELMKTLYPNPYDDPFNCFKLSYPPNPKYPQMVDCLELRKDNKGIHVVTTRDLKTGDVIAIEDPVNPTIFDAARLHRCSFCLKDQLMNLFPCSGCAMAMFCSEKCREEAMNGLHQYECIRGEVSVFPFGYPAHLMVHCFRVFKNDIAELRKFLEDNKDPVTVFDFDFSDPEDPMYEKNMLLVAISNVFGYKSSQIENLIPDFRMSTFTLVHKTFDEIYQKDPSLLELIKTSFEFRMGYIMANFNSKQINLYKHFSQQHNSFHDKGIQTTLVGAATYPLRKLLNHSCDPNVDSLHVAGKNVIYACKPTKKGSELYHSVFAKYCEISSSSIGKRDEQFLGFKSDCKACMDNWPTFMGLPAVDPFFQHHSLRFLPPHDEAKKNIARNNAYIDKNYKERKPTHEVIYAIKNNFYEMHALARPSFYP